MSPAPKTTTNVHVEVTTCVAPLLGSTEVAYGLDRGIAPLLAGGCAQLARTPKKGGERGSVFVLLCSNRWGNEDTGLFPVQSPQNAERNSELQP